MALKIPIEHTKLVDSAFDGSKDFPFEVKTSQIAGLIEDMTHGRRTSYLISGYRGSGKSSLIKKLQLDIEAAEANKPEADAKTVFFFLDIPKYESRSIILRKIIRTFYAQLAEEKRNEPVYKKLQANENTNVKLEQLHDLYEKTFYDVSHEVSKTKVKKKIKTYRYTLDYKGLVTTIVSLVLFFTTVIGALIGWDLGAIFESKTFTNILIAVLAALWATLRVLEHEQEHQREKTSVDARIKKSFYDDEIAEYYLKERLAALKDDIKPIFVLDELDKISEHTEIESVINDLKPLFLSGHASFIVVAGQTFFYHYFHSSRKDDHILSTLFSKVYHVELQTPASLRLTFNTLSKVDKTGWTPEQFNYYDAFVDKLIFESRRVPRKFISIIRQNLKWKEKESWLDVDKELKDLAIYTTFINCLDVVDDKEISREDYPVGIKDLFRAQIYLKAGLIFGMGGSGFSVNELLNDKDPLNPVDESLAPQLKEYLKSLLRKLKEAGILGSKSDDANRKTIYFRKNYQAKQSPDDMLDPVSGLLNEYEGFKRIIKDIYGNLSLGPAGSKDTTPLTEMITTFEQRNVFVVRGKDQEDIKDVLDNGSNLLKTANVVEKAARRFNEFDVRFPELITAAFDFYAQEQFRKNFPEFSIRKDKTELAVSFTATTSVQKFPELLVDVKFRKDAETELNQDITKAYELLLRHNERTGNENCVLLILYTEISQSDLDRLEYTFKQFLREQYASHAKRIFFVPIDTKNLHFIERKLQAVRDQIISLNSNLTPFKFFTQKEGNRPTSSDDHYFSKHLNLGHHSFRVHISPIAGMTHWRFGCKFSNTQEDGGRRRRQSVGVPLFYLEKNSDTSILKYTFYDDSAKHSFTRDTLLANYTSQKLILQVRPIKGGLEIDILDELNVSVIEERVTIMPYSWAFVFAWADAKNYFEFNTIIEEILEIKEETF